MDKLEKYLSSLIKKKSNKELLFERMEIIAGVKINEDVRTFNFNDYKTIDSEKPLSQTDKIRVYHGFNNISQALLAAIYGLSGKERARRIYSYEMGNNPKGLFVTIDFQIAKRFTGGSMAVIMEFDTSYENLEAPTWVGGRSYFVQGEYTKSFANDDERKEQMMKNRERASKSDDERISKSHNPEVAETLFNNPEKQALFVGDLNPNMIKYFWVREENNTSKPFNRMSRKEFLKKYNTEENRNVIRHTFKGFEAGPSDDEINKINMLFQPNDDFSLSKLKKLDYWDDYLKDDLTDVFKGIDNYSGKQILKTMLYPKQLDQVKRNFGLNDKLEKI